jgi:hypothetical protein
VNNSKKDTYLIEIGENDGIHDSWNKDQNGCKNTAPRRVNQEIRLI